MAVLWVHSGGWLSRAAISYIGVHNGASFAAAGQDSHLLMPAAAEDGAAEAHLQEYYGVQAQAKLHLQLFSEKRRWWQIHHPYYGYGERYALRLRKALPADEKLVILTREPRFLPYLAKLSRVPGIVGLYESHYFYYDLGWREGPVSKGDRMRGNLERRYLPQISGIVAIASEQAKLFAQAMPHVPVLFSPLGAKHLPESLISRKREEQWRQRRTVAYIGHLFAYKGVDALVAYGTRLKQKNINAVFFGGTPEEVARYEKICAEQGADNLRWHPFLPPAAMFQALAGCASVGLVALEDNYYNRHLTCPVKALDFLSLGIPVVASDLPCTRDVLGEAGVYFPPGDTEAMLERICALLDDGDSYAHRARSGLDRAEQLSWKNRAAQILAFANQLK
ncbi:glycosyltransferase [Azospira inquinata]|uniref:Glycosyltransferase n=1 Tax=Azospira inquinata TaxID=2785627 RepID=A0A975SKC3_9RHOO|nr:glycosyltransferase [Azospira inquinata]QWT46758.1 glycosyltransferase [Azospira inquinata]QWT47919.1 glycosyltransferase [Azospira inquinata]